MWERLVSDRNPNPASPMASWRERLLGAFEAVDPESREAFQAELTDTNRRRLRALLALMIVLHALHAGFFWPSPELRATLAPNLLQWRDGLVLVHGSTAGVAVLLLAAAWRPGRYARLLAPVAGASYLLHAAAIAAVDQLSTPTVSPYMGYSLAVAVILVLTPAEALCIYAIGLTAYVTALVTMQPAMNVRMALLPSGPSITLASLFLAYFLYAGRRRDFVQRGTIDRQRGLLEALNGALEHRVREQVAEIVARAQEVDQLNAQLRAQVRQQSSELALALDRLGDRPRAGDGLLPGTVLGGRFEIGAPLGAGGMGVVYAGLDRSTGARVAIKVVQASSAAQRDALHRFVREAAMAAAITHPGVVRMLHVDVTQDGLFYQVQELVVGETVQALLRRVGRCRATVVARIGEVLSDALAAAHTNGVVHRDVKPANLILTAVSPGLKLLDFGVSKLHEDVDLSDATRTGVILGTPAFMGPEQLGGSKDVTDRADVYAVGVTLFLLLTGQFPFPNTTLAAMLMNHALGTAPDVRTIEPTVPDVLAEWIGRCLAKDPLGRPSAAEVAVALRAFADLRDPRPLDAMVRAEALGEGPSAGGSTTVSVLVGPVVDPRTS